MPLITFHVLSEYSGSRDKGCVHLKTGRDQPAANLILQILEETQGGGNLDEKKGFQTHSAPILDRGPDFPFTLRALISRQTPRG